MKYIVTALLSFATISAYALDAEKAGKTITTDNGDKITFTQVQTDHVTVIEKNSGDKELKRFERVAERPNTLNGQMIIHDLKATPELLDVAGKTSALISEVLRKADILSAGCYQFTIPDIVIDEQGNVVYYSKAEVKDGDLREYAKYKIQYHDIAENEKALMEDLMVELMSELKTEPLVIDGKAAPYTISYKSSIAG